MHKTVERDNGTLHIIGNGHARELLDVWDLERLGIDVPDWIDPNDYDFGYQFFLFKGELYCLADFTRTTTPYSPFRDFDGYASDSFFSGTLVKFADLDDYGTTGVKVYWYYC